MEFEQHQFTRNRKGDRLELKMTSHPANLQNARKQIENFVQSVGMAAMADAVGLALNEALANVIRHGYDSATDKPIEVLAEKANGELRVSIRDWGKRFDPSQSVAAATGGNDQAGWIGIGLHPPIDGRSEIRTAGGRNALENGEEGCQR
jgi:anti-sigma regulatory factor (Ser/Thr protein kinase)